MVRSYVMDELHNQHRFAHTGTAKEPDLAAQGIGCNQIYDFDTGFHDLCIRGLFCKRRCAAMNGPVIGCFHRSRIVIHRLAQHIEHAAQAAFAHRDRNGFSCVVGFHIPCQSVRAAHSHRTHHIIADMLHHFRGQVHVHMFCRLCVNGDSVKNGGQLFIREADIHHRASDLHDVAHMASFFGS